MADDFVLETRGLSKEFNSRCGAASSASCLRCAECARLAAECRGQRVVASLDEVQTPLQRKALGRA